MLANPSVLRALGPLVLLAAPSAQQLDVRPSQQLAPFLQFSDFAVDTQGETSVALFSSRFPRKIMASVSDGRGLSWSAPVTLNPSSSLAFLRPGTVCISGSRIYALWSETNPERLFFGRSLDEGATWEDPVELDIGFASGGRPRNWALHVETDPAGDHLYVLFSASSQPFPADDDDLFLISSHDGGDAFSAALPVSTGNGTPADVDDLVLTADGTTVHALWTDDRRAPGGTANDVFYRRSVDGGLSFEPEVSIDRGGPFDGRRGLSMARRADELVIAWREDRPDPVVFARNELRVRTSNDAGQSFSAVRQVGGYEPFVDILGFLDLVATDAGFVLGWSDWRSGVAEIYTSRSVDGGGSWIAEQQVSPPTTFGHEGPVLAANGDDVGIVFGLAQFTRFACFSPDGGTSWSEAAVIGTPSLARWLPQIVINERYRNALTFWSDAPGGGDDQLWVSGFRPQSLRRSSAGSSLSWQLEGFRDGFPEALVLLALDQDDALGLPNGDGRLVGLAQDRLFGYALDHPLWFRAPLENGAAVLGPVPLTPALSGTIHAVGLSWDPAGAGFGDLTDVVEVTPVGRSTGRTTGRTTRSTTRDKTPGPLVSPHASAGPL